MWIPYFNSEDVSCWHRAVSALNSLVSSEFFLILLRGSGMGSAVYKYIDLSVRSHL